MRKRKLKNFIDEYMPEIIFLVLIILFALGFGGAIHKCTHNEDYINYGNEDYIFVDVCVDYGKHGTTYSGTILKSDYDRWLNGETGTMFIYSPVKENMGNIINIQSIAVIVNHGSEPDWLPLNFGY